jgi:hypothetical protein
MGLWSRLFGSGAQASFAPSDDRSLVDPPSRPSPSRGPSVQATPWSAVRLGSIFAELSANPSPDVVTEGRKARHCISRFWLTAPVDQLEMLYRSPIGQSYRALVSGPLPTQPLERSEQEWRDGLARRLMENFDRPETTNLLLAVMPYFDRGKMRVANPLQQIPQWLLPDYAALCDPALQQRFQRPVGLLGPAGSSAAGLAYPPQQLGQQPQPQPSQPPALPLLSARRGNEALALIQNQQFMGRMSGLINLYTIDPSDAEVKRELTGLRRQLGQVWLDVNPAQIQQLYQSSFGLLFRNLLSSGFASEPLMPDDQQIRIQLSRFVANMSQPRAINALLAALPFYPPGKIQFGGGEQFIPAWLLSDLNALGAIAAPGLR